MWLRGANSAKSAFLSGLEDECLFPNRFRLLAISKDLEFKWDQPLFTRSETLQGYGGNLKSALGRGSKV